MKKRLKNILPPTLRKKIFLHYNIARTRTIDKLLFPELKLESKDFLLYRNEKPLEIYKIKLDTTGNKQVNNLMKFWDNWRQEEYIYVNRQKGYIEPEYGWFITDTKKLNFFSLGISRAPHQKKPSVKAFYKKHITRHFEKIISCRDTGEENYFHFYNDVLTKIFFLSANEFDVLNIPILVSEKLYNKPYFIYFAKNHPFLSCLNWVVQKNDFVSSNEIIFCKPLTHRIELLKAITDPFVKKFADSDLKQSIFLIRSPERFRFIENITEIEQICKQADIKMIDADKLTIEQQIKEFGNSKNIIAIHGAGLTNILYRMGKPCKVLEIFPPPEVNYLPFHYQLLAKQLGFQYEAIVGEKPKKKFSGGFHLDALAFAKTINIFLRERT